MPDPNAGMLPHDINNKNNDPTIRSLDPGQEADKDIFGSIP